LFILKDHSVHCTGIDDHNWCGIFWKYRSLPLRWFMILYLRAWFLMITWQHDHWWSYCWYL